MIFMYRSIGSALDGKSWPMINTNANGVRPEGFTQRPILFTTFSAGDEAYLKIKVGRDGYYIG